MAANKHRTSLKDLAQELGVSIATVSRALRNSPEIGREMQEKVKALPAEGREDAVAKLLNDQTDSFYSMVAGKWRELKGRVLEIFVRSM